MKAILLTGGVGDIITIESLMTDGERNAINCIFYATRAASPCMELISSIPTFPNLKNQSILWRNFNSIFAFNSKEQFVDKLCAYQPEDLQRTVRKLTQNIEDWSIAKVFNEKREYTYSSFIRFRMTYIDHFNLPDKYYCICPSTNNDKRDARRDFNIHDWTGTINILKKRGLPGVIINKGEDFIPEDDILINLNNRTTMKEAVEIVKGSSGYIGIDSALSVIATNVCVPNNILIKSINDHCYRWAHLYFTPHKTFEFMKREIRDQ